MWRPVHTPLHTPLDAVVYPDKAPCARQLPNQIEGRFVIAYPPGLWPTVSLTIDVFRVPSDRKVQVCVGSASMIAHAASPNPTTTPQKSMGLAFPSFVSCRRNAGLCSDTIQKRDLLPLVQPVRALRDAEAGRWWESRRRGAARFFVDVFARPGPSLLPQTQQISHLSKGKVVDDI